MTRPNRDHRLPGVWLGIVALLALSACAGGSGSSGFDISPGFENARIALSLDESRCVESAGLTICPADRPPSSTPAPNDPTPNFGDVAVLSGVVEAGGLRCSFTDESSDACTVDLSPSAVGLGDDRVLQVAVRAVDPLSDWMIVDAVSASGGTVFAQVPASYERVQVAILVFSDGEALASGTLGVLAEGGADLVFVTDVVAVNADTLADSPEGDAP